MEYGLVLRWLVAYAVLAGLGRTVAARLFSTLPGRGVGFGLPTALVVVGTTAYWVGQAVFGFPALAAGVVVLVALALVAGLDVGALRARRLRLNAGVRPDRRTAEAAAVFVVAFGVLVAVRAVDPAVSPVGGEKFLDFGLLKSLDRAESLPPEDMWFAGEPVRYYYGGHLLTALLADLTATPTRYAYNLSLAGFYAMLVTAAYGLAGAVGREHAGSWRAAGLAAAFFVGVASNLVTAGRLLVGRLPGPFRADVIRAVAARTRYSTDAVAGGVDTFSYWTASRVIPGTINEFPLFAWLNGDLHAHMMGMPFLLLAAALAFAIYRTPAGDLSRRRRLAFVAVPLLAGFQTVVDTWSVPSVFGLLFLAVALGPADPWPLLSRRLAAWRRNRSAGPLVDELEHLGGALAVAGVAGVFGAVLSFPFLLGAGSGREVALLGAAERSSLPALLLVHGGFVVVFLAYLLDRLSVDRVVAPLVGIGALGLLAATANLAVILVSGPLLVLGWAACRTDRPVGFETVLIVAGAGLVGLVELVYVVEQAGPLRMNTVFKTYMQVWVLWGVAAGVAVPAFVRWAGGASIPGLRSRWLRAGLAVAVVAATVPYAGLAFSAHFGAGAGAGAGAGGDPTLDATAFVEREHPDEAAAIAYVDALPGRPTLLSAPATGRYPGPGGDAPAQPGMYGWESSPAASLTGVPTVAGWHHEVGYRGREPYLSRVRDVDDAYTGSPERTVEVLAAYGVDYVWVGPAERARYGSVTFEGVDGLTPVFETDAVTIYRVEEPRVG
jgi:YYY domain-containing protein